MSPKVILHERRLAEKLYAMINKSSLFGGTILIIISSIIKYRRQIAFFTTSANSRRKRVCATKPVSPTTLLSFHKSPVVYSPVDVSNLINVFELIGSRYSNP